MDKFNHHFLMGLVAIVGIVAVISIIASLETGQFQPQQTAGGAVKIIDGGGGGGSTPSCYSDGDCPSESSPPFCDGDRVCGYVTNYRCENPGAVNARCVSSGGGLGCSDCEFGCEEAECSDPVYAEALAIKFPTPYTEVTGEVVLRTLLLSEGPANYFHIEIEDEAVADYDPWSDAECSAICDAQFGYADWSNDAYLLIGGVEYILRVSALYGGVYAVSSGPYAKFDVSTDGGNTWAGTSPIHPGEAEEIGNGISLLVEDLVPGESVKFWIGKHVQSQTQCVAGCYYEWDTIPYQHDPITGTAVPVEVTGDMPSQSLVKDVYYRIPYTPITSTTVQPINPSEGPITGDQKCQEIGYNRCLFTEHTETAVYFDSTGIQCLGTVQFYESTSDIINCSNSVYPTTATCLEANGEEPRAGDFELTNGFEVVCAK